MYRLRFLAIEVFKCVNGINPPYLNNMFTQKSIGYNLRDSSILEQNKFTTLRYGYKSFRYFGSKLWNSLPHDVKNSETICAFKRNITRWCYSDDAQKLEIF